MQMAELQGTLQRDGERGEGRAVLAQHRDITGLGVGVGVVLGRGVGGRQGCRRHATGHGDVGVDVEFEEVVERVGEGGDCALYCFRDPVVQGQWAGGLVAGDEGDILEFA